MKKRQSVESLAEQHPRVPYHFDLEGHFTQVFDQSCHKLTGYTPEELLDKSLSSLVIEEDREKAQSCFQKAAYGGSPIYEAKLRRKDGTVLPVSIKHTPLIESGKVVGITGIIRDSTRETELKDAILRTEEFYKNLFSSAGEAILSIENGLVTSWNKGAEGIFGLKREAILGESFEVLFPDDVRKHVDDLIHTARNEGSIRKCDTVGLHANGDTFYLSLSISPIQTSQKTSEGVMAIISDVTEQKALERKMETIYNLGKQMTTTREPGAICRLAAEAMKEVLKFENYLVLLLETDAEYLKVMDYGGFLKDAEEIRFPLTDNVSIPVQCVRRRAPLCVHTFSTQTEFQQIAPQIQSELAVPIDGLAGVIGVLDVASENTANFRREDQEMLEILASQTGVALENAWSVHRIFETEASYTNLFKNCHDAILTTSMDGKIRDANPAAVEMFGYPSEEELQSIENVRELYVEPKHRDRFVTEIEQEGSIKDSELHYRRRDGERWIGVETAHLLRDMDGKAEEIQSIIRDITQWKELERELQEKALKDQLTGVYNRHYFYEVIRKEIERSKRYKQDISVVILDINNFKRVNDHYSHLKGDEVLKAMAELLKETVRGSDSIIRYGGDEFLLLLPQTTEQGAQELIDRIKERLFLFNEQRDFVDFDLSVSFGCATQEEGEEFNETLKRADAMMYERK